VELLPIIPALLAAWMEDRELLERDSRAHAEYSQNTGALLPRRDLLGFLHLLFVDLLSPGAKIL
jgi:hypothetical protein